MGFQINVSSNVSDAYGANVYGVAVQNIDGLSIADVKSFFETNKQTSWTQLGPHIPANVDNNTVPVSGTMTSVYDNLGGTATAGTIPHAFVDYTVYVAAENDLGLVSVESAGRHNGYSIVSVEDLLLNQVIAFTDSDPENTLTANISSTLSLGGNIMHYAVVGFSDPSVTDEEAHWYADQRLSAAGSDVALFGTTSVPFVNIQTQITKVVGVLDHVNAANSIVYDIDDVNAGQVYVILKDVGPAGISQLDGIGSNHYGVETSVLVINSANEKAHASVKQVRTNGNEVNVDVRGFSAFSVPTQFVAVAVPHGTSVDSGLGVTLTSTVLAAGEVLRVFDHTFTFAGSLDLSKEYDVYAQFVTSDATKTSVDAVMYSNLEDPTLTGTSQTLTTDTEDPSATLTAVVLDAQKVSGVVNLNAHPLILDATATKVQVVLSVHDNKTVTDLVTFLAGAGVGSGLYHETTNAMDSFSLSTTLEGYPVSQVSRVYVYALVTTEDESYLFRRLAVSPDVVSRNETEDLFVTFGDVSMEYTALDANVDVLFNKGASALTDAFVVLTTHGYLTSDPITGILANPETNRGVTRITDLSPANPLQPNELRVCAAATHSFTGAYNAAVLTHEITVRVESGKYVFSPDVSEFLKGHTYIFDNRLAKTSHPLNFDYEDDVSPYNFTPDAATGYTTVVIPADAAYTALFAHCAVHSGMGSIVNNGATGIPVIVVPSSVDDSIDLVSDQVYYVNVVTSTHGVYHGPLLEPNAAGIREITAGFEATDGNVELTGITLNVLDPANETLKLVAYTYLLPNKNAAYTAAAEAVVSTSLSTFSTAGLVSFSAGSSVILDKVIDIAGEVYAAISTRNVYVYGWIENAGNKTSVFVTNALTPADQLYPHVTLVEYQDTNKLVVPVGGLTVVESGGSKVDKFYLMAFDSAVTTLGASFDYSPFMTVDKITEDIDQSSDDIYTNATKLNILYKYTSATDASLTDGVRPGQTVTVVLVAVSTDTGYKAFVKEFTVPSDVTGIHGAFSPMFSADKKSLRFMSGQARGPGQVRVGVFTNPQTDPVTAAGANYYSPTVTLSGQLSYLSALFSIPLTQTTTAASSPVLLEHVNRVYVYAWVYQEAGGGVNSAVASAVAKHTNTKQFYTQIRDVDYVSGSSLTIDTSVFAFAKAVTEYYVGVIESSYAATLTDSDIITALTADYLAGDPSPVKAYTTLLAQNAADTQTATILYALESSSGGGGSSGVVAALANHQYNVYLLAKNSTAGEVEVEELTGPVMYAINLPGVTEITNLVFDRVNNQVTFDVTANGLDNAGGNTDPGTLRAVAFTYANPTHSTGVNALVGASPKTVISGSSGVTVTGLTINKVRTRLEQVDPNFVNEVHVYVWLERGVEQSLVYSGSIAADATPYPAIHNAVQLENGSVFSGSLTIFDDADGYYLGLFPADEIATAYPAELFYGFFVDNNLLFTPFPVTDGNVGNVVDFTMTAAYTDLSNSGITPAIAHGVEYKIVAIAVLNGGSFTMTQSESLVAFGGAIPSVENFGIVYNATDDTADVVTVDLIVPASVTSGTFYALATTYPITNALNAPKLNNAARVTLASGVTSSVTGFSLANAFPKVMDLSGDLVDFKSVRAAYAYAWGVNASTGDVGQVIFAANGFDGPNTDPVPRLTVVSADPTERTLTVEAASVFSATHNVDKYMIFAMKDISQTSADVLTFVNAHLESFIEFTGGVAGGSHKTPFGEHNDFDPDLLEDDLYNVPAYSVVITQAFTQTANAEANELVVSGNSYRVYMAAKDTNGTTNLYEYPALLDLDAVLDTSIARVGVVHSVTLDNSVQNNHTVSFGLDSVTASSVENAEVYAAIFTRDLKNEKLTGSIGDFKNEVYSTETRLSPVLFVPAGTTIAVNTRTGFKVNKAFDTNGDLVDLYTVNTGYLYAWARTLGTTTISGRSAIQEENDMFAPPPPPFTFTIDGNEYSPSAINPLYQITLDEDTNARSTKTPWVLVLNYVHKGGTTPALNVRNTTKGLPVLPENGSLDFNTFDINASIQNGSTSDPSSWGHAGIDLFNKTCIALDSLSGNDNGVEVRFVGKTNDHPRIMHFKTGKFEFLKDFRYGDQPQQGGVNLTEGTDFTLLNNHSAFLPTGSVTLYTGVGNAAMTNYPFYISSQRYWGISQDGTRWDVDNHTSNSSKNTYHQIWVRADKA